MLLMPHRGNVRIEPIKTAYTFCMPNSATNLVVKGHPNLFSPAIKPHTRVFSETHTRVYGEIGLLNRTITGHAKHVH